MPPFHPDRREFGKLALSGALGTAAFLNSAGGHAKAMQPNQPGIKLCAQSSARPTDEQLLFLKQIGAEYVSVGSTPDLRTADGFAQIKKRYADAGITVWNIGNTDIHNMPEVTLNLPAGTKRSKSTSGTFETSPRQAFVIQRTPIWATESGVAAERTSEALPPENSTCRAPIKRAFGPTRVGRNRSHMGALHERGDLGELRVLHQAGCPGRRRGGCPDRDPSR